MSKRDKIISAVAAVVLAIGLVTVIALLTTRDGSVSAATTPPSPPTTFSTWTPYTAPNTPPPPPKPVVLAGDFSVELKVLSKQCFGSAGCNLTVDPNIKYLGTYTVELTCDLTYAVFGDESGEVIETAEHITGNSYRVRQTFLSTKSTKVVPTASMIGVSCK